jgi:fatty acid desaturase
MSDMDQRPQRNPSVDSDRAKLIRARRRVAALKGFYIHFFVFLLVMAILLAINVLAGGPWWSLIVLAIWGIAILVHWLVLRGGSSNALGNWEKRKLKQFIAEDR